MPEKCALSFGSGVLGRDPRDTCCFWSPHVEKVCTVTQFRLGEGGGRGGGGEYHWGGGGVGEPRTGIIYASNLDMRDSGLHDMFGATLKCFHTARPKPLSGV